MIIICDLDGTLADDRHRRKYLIRRPKAYNRYHAESRADTIVTPVARLLRAYEAVGYRIAIWTGRPECYRDPTEEWLGKHDIPYHALRMRADGDYRDVNDVKDEWLRALPHRPTFALDDRDKCVAWWHANCVDVLQVRFAL